MHGTPEEMEQMIRYGIQSFPMDSLELVDVYFPQQLFTIEETKTWLNLTDALFFFFSSSQGQNIASQVWQLLFPLQVIHLVFSTLLYKRVEC